MRELLDTYGQHGLQVLAVPCNQFGRQEPGTAAEIKRFAREEMGFSGLLSEKVEVNGSGEHPLFTVLKVKHPGPVEWNFEKWLVDVSGEVFMRYEDSIPVADESIQADIRHVLGLHDEM